MIKDHIKNGYYIFKRSEKEEICRVRQPFIDFFGGEISQRIDSDYVNKFIKLLKKIDIHELLNG